MIFLSILALNAVSVVIAGAASGQPDPSLPPGYFESPIVVPSPLVRGDGNWTDSVARARAIVLQMTPLELQNFTTGGGTAGKCVGMTGSVPRLGIKEVCHQDGPIGVRIANNASAFPSAISTGASWDKILMYQRGLDMGAEFRGKGVNIALSPDVNLVRAPAAGRNWEAFSADPYLSGVAGALTVQGIQENGVVACIKHLVAYEQETNRGQLRAPVYSSNVDDRTMHELYLWPFADAVYSGVGSVMSSYNKINQTYAAENSKMLNGLLKNELDFQGYVVSDWWGDNSYIDAALAGLDVIMPGQGLSQFDQYADSSPIFAGIPPIQVIPTPRLQDAATRLLASMFQMGQDDTYPEVKLSATDFETVVGADHYKGIRALGAASTVLLKNAASFLPFDPNTYQRWGIFGSASIPNPNGINSCGNTNSCNEGALTEGWGSGSAYLPYVVAGGPAITELVLQTNPSATFVSALNDTDLATASSVASKSDVCIVFVTADSGEFGVIPVESTIGDRLDLNLWHGGNELIQSVAESCPNTLVVVNSVGSVLMESWVHLDSVRGIFWAGLPGQESGNGLADVIFGLVNPSGRLPYTIGKSANDYSAQVDFSNSVIPGAAPVQIDYTDALLIDYIWFDAKGIEPTFPFGFGLSYSSFQYSNPLATVISKSSSSRRAMFEKRAVPGGTAALYADAVNVEFDLTNISDREGAEVSQLYLTFPEAAKSPPQSLRGFEKTMVTPGQTVHLTIPISLKGISIWDVITQDWIIIPGVYTVSIGGSSRDAGKIVTTFTQ